MTKESVGQFGSYKFVVLGKEFASQHAQEIARLLNFIPLVQYSVEDALVESKGDLFFRCKWELSLAAMTGKTLAGVIMGYERRADGIEYLKNSIYISELAIAPEHQRKGVARALLALFIKRVRSRGLIMIEGPTILTVQTNSAPWNRHVQMLYESFGFKKVSTKTYANRVDWIMEASDQEYLPLRS